MLCNTSTVIELLKLPKTSIIESGISCVEKKVTLKFTDPYEIKPKDFVKGFDLTFCMNYFDGETLVSYHPECVASRKGYVMKEVDMKTSERIKKYEYRGYSVLNNI